MKSIRCLALLALTSAVAFVSAASTAFEAVVGICSRAWDYGADLALKVLTGPAAHQDSANTPAIVGFVKAKAFNQRLIKRERPVLSPTWRMCPSI